MMNVSITIIVGMRMLLLLFAMRLEVGHTLGASSRSGRSSAVLLEKEDPFCRNPR